MLRRVWSGSVNFFLANPSTLFSRPGFSRRSLFSSDRHTRSRFVDTRNFSIDSDVMFKRSFASKDRVGKTVKPIKKPYGDQAKVKMQEKLDSPTVGSPLTSPIITLVVGREQRLFAAHEDVLSLSPFFCTALKDQFLDGSAKQVNLPDE